MMVPIHLRYDQWEQYNKELEDLNLSVNNFTVSRLYKFEKCRCLSKLIQDMILN